MSRHMDAVATSTLHQEQSRPQLARRKLYNSTEDKVATTPGCRDNTWLSRHQLYREKVATTSGCRDNNCTEKRSRQHQDVAKTSVQRRGRDNTRMSRQQLYREEVATTPSCRNNSCKDQNVATSISCRDVSFNEKRPRQEQAVTTPPSLKTCRNNTEAPTTRTATRPATRTATRTDVTTRALCRDNISLLGQFTKVQKEMHRN